MLQSNLKAQILNLSAKEDYNDESELELENELDILFDMKNDKEDERVIAEK